jgi:transcriptional regulator
MVQELKKGTAELLVLSLIEERARHGYEIAKLIGTSTEGEINFHAASLYPLLYRLEQSKRIRGRWVEKPGQRRRRYYELTAAGRKALEEQRTGWRTFVRAMSRIVGESHA